MYVWDVATGQTVRRLSGHLGKIHAVEFNEDASVVASGEIALSFPFPFILANRTRFVRFHRTFMGPQVCSPPP